MKETERERVFLVKELPDISDIRPLLIRVGDFFEPNRIDALKLKQKGDSFFLVKKEGDSVHERVEHRIPIKRGEFDVLWNATMQKHEKLRYICPIGEHVIELDLYQGRLAGYVRAEIEFDSESALRAFTPPSWFGPEITEWNHDIHEDLGIISFDDMKKRLLEKGIELNSLLPK